MTATEILTEDLPDVDRALHKDRQDNLADQISDVIEDPYSSRGDLPTSSPECALHEMPVYQNNSRPVSVDADWELTGAHEPENSSESVASEPARVLKSDKEGYEQDGQEGCLEIPKWRPFWLHPLILCAFGVLFASVMAILIFLAIHSETNFGLANADDKLAYVWRFGPTACKSSSDLSPVQFRMINDNNPIVFTLMSVVWARIELQVLRYAPWFLIQHEGTRADNYDLDYTEMLLPALLFQSLKRKHFIVFVVAITTLALKIQIALSSSIFRSTFVSIPQRLDVQIRDVFKEGEPPEGFGIDPFAYIQAIQHYGLDLPFGVTSDCAYQTFTVLDSDGKEFDLIPDEPVTVTVDGLFMDTECLLLEDYTVFVNETGEPWLGNLVIDLQFESCEERVRFPASLMRDGQMDNGKHSFLGTTGGEALLWANSRRPCSSLPQQHQQFVVVVTDFATSSQTLLRRHRIAHPFMWRVAQQLFAHLEPGFQRSRLWTTESVERFRH